MTFVLSPRLISTYVCISYVLYIQSMSFTTLSFIKARAQFKLASAIFNSTFLQQHQVYSSTTSRYAIPSVITYAIINTSPYSPHLSPRLRDRWILVSWGGLPIKNPAPYQTWTEPLLCRRGRRARLEPLFHRTPEERRTTVTH